MRVTNSMMVSNYLNNLNNSMSKMDNLRGQLATNRKYMHISDDPVSLIYSQQARDKLHALSVYQGNVAKGQEWLTQTETSFMELNSLIQAAYEQTVDASTDVKSESDREAISHYMGQLRDQMLTLLNSTYGDKYCFGGYNTTGYVENREVVTPFNYVEEPVDEYIDDTLSEPELSAPENIRTVTYRKLTYNGIDVTSQSPGDLDKLSAITADVLNLDMGAGIRMDVSMNGVNVMNFAQADGTAINIYNLLDQLTVALESGAGVDEINNFIKPLQDCQSHVLSLTAELGGKTNRLELMASRYEQDELNYTQMKSDAEDADEAEVIMRFKMAESVYQAALATGAYVIQPTLMDFLR